MVLFQVITPDQAYDAIDLPILGLLFGTMVVSVYLEQADMFKYLGHLLSWKSFGAKDLLCRICLVSAISSALFTNDTSCVVLTEFVLKIARQHNLPPHPFLLALASSANIGSSATPIGNPQNLVIAVQSKITFGTFLFGIFPAMIVGVCVNALLLLCMYWKVLSVQKDEEDGMEEVVGQNDVTSSHRFSPATLSHATSLNSQDLNLSSTLDSNNVDVEPTLRNRGYLSESNSIHSSPSIVNSKNEGEIDKDLNVGFESNRKSDEVEYNGFVAFVEESLGFSKKWKHVLWKTCVYLVTLGMLISLLAGVNMSWAAITAALALVVLDFKDARPCLEKVSIGLMICCYYFTKLATYEMIYVFYCHHPGIIFIVDILLWNVHHSGWIQ